MLISMSETKIRAPRYWIAATALVAVTIIAAVANAYVEKALISRKDIAKLNGVAARIYAGASGRPAQLLLAQGGVTPCGFGLLQSPDEIVVFGVFVSDEAGPRPHLISTRETPRAALICDFDYAEGRVYEDFAPSSPPPDPALVAASLAKVKAYQACMARNFKDPRRDDTCQQHIAAQ